MSNQIAKKLHEEGVALFRKGNPAAALEKFNQALQNATEHPRQMAELYNDIGVTQKELEDFDAAHLALDEAMAQFTALGDAKGQAQTLGNRGAVLEAEGLTEEAVEAYKEAAKGLEAVGESEMAMYSWQAISRLRTKQGQYIAAIGAYEEGVDNMPKGSFKQKILQQILKAPGAFLGGGSKETDEEEDKED